MPRFGVYVGNSTSALTAYETWLGAPTGQILAFTGEADWDDYQTSVPWAKGLWGAVDRPVMWSVPLLATGGTLSQAAAGDYNSFYLSAAQDLATFRPSDPTILIRTAWEFNGNWMKWAALGKEADFIAAFRQFVNTFRSVSSRFRFGWCVNLGNVGMNPEAAYPGDAYVDVVGLDVYYNTQFDNPDPVLAFEFMKIEQYGLQWHVDFANARGKAKSFCEWGVMTATAGPWIDRLHQWMIDHDFLCANYWDSNAAFPGKLSDGQYPAAGNAYRLKFSQTTGDNPPAPPGGNTAMALPYSPYVTTYDVVVDLDVTPDDRTFNGTRSNGKHVKVIGRRNVIDQRRGLCFYDCASVTIIGGHFEPPVNGFPLNSANPPRPTPGTLTFQGCGSVYLEGVVTDNKNLIVTDANIASMGANGGDAVYFSGGNSRSRYLNGNFTAQNCCFLNVRGVQTTPNGSVKAHGDVFQTGSTTQGKAGHVRFYNVTASCDYQGFFLDPQAPSAATSTTTYYPGGNAGVTMNRVNIRRFREPGSDFRLMFLFSSMTNYNSRGYPVSMTDFHVQGFTNEPIEQLIWPNNSPGSNGFTSKYQATIASDSIGRYATYPGLTDAGKVVSGRIRQGAPAGGDFVTTSQVGRNYVQGTDLVAGTTPTEPTDPGTPTPPVITPLPVGRNNLIRPENWVGGGTGTRSISATTGAIAITPANDTTRTYWRQAVAVTPGKSYAITYDLFNVTQMWRMLGTTEGAEDILPVNVSTVPETRVTFTASTPVVWFEFNRISAGTATVGSVRFEEIIPERATARRLNGRSQAFSINASAAGLRTSNATQYVGGWFKFHYMPTAAVYLLDMAIPDAVATGGQQRARILYDPTVPKIMASNAGATKYAENLRSTTGILAVDEWHYVGMILAGDGGVSLVYDGTIGGTTIGTGVPEVANYLGTLQLGARVGTTPTNYANAVLGDWVWCNGFIPTNAQITALAAGNRPTNIAGFAPTHVWRMDQAGNTEPSVTIAAATLTATTAPATVTGPEYTAPPSDTILPCLFF